MKTAAGRSPHALEYMSLYNKLHISAESRSACQLGNATTTTTTTTVPLLQVLNDIQARFMQEDGDFMSYPDRAGNSRKSDNQEQTEYWPYMNAWVAMAAHRLGR